MAQNGARTDLLPEVAMVDEVLGNAPGGTGRISLAALTALVRASTGPDYPDRASLFGDLDWPTGTIATVWDDADVANNGVYRKNSSSDADSWTRIGPLPESSTVRPLFANNIGGVNKIAATTAVSVKDKSLVVLPIVNTVTDAVSVIFNDLPELSMLTNGGNQVSPGGLVGGMVVIGVVDLTAGTYQLMTWQDALASEALAERFANEDEDVVVRVDGGVNRYSGNHYNKKAELNKSLSQIAAATSNIAAGRAEFTDWAELAKFVYDTPGPDEVQVAEGTILTNKKWGYALEVLDAADTSDLYPPLANIKVKAVPGPNGFTSRQFDIGSHRADNSAHINYFFKAFAAALAEGKGVDAAFNGNDDIPFSSPINLHFNTTVTRGGVLRMGGVVLDSNVGSGIGHAFVIDRGDGAYVRNVHIDYPSLRSSGNEDGMLLWDGGSEGSNGAFYLSTLWCPTIEDFKGAGLEIKGHFFESSVYDPSLSAYNFISDPSFVPTTDNVPLLLDNAGGQISSFKIYGGTTRHGYNGFYGAGGSHDISIVHLTVLETWHEGFVYPFCQNGLISKLHLENTWMHDDGSAVKPGAYIVGSVTIDEIRCTNTPVASPKGHATAVIQAFSSGVINLRGMTRNQNVAKTLSVANSSDTTGAKIMAPGADRSTIELVNVYAGGVLDLGSADTAKILSNAAGSIALETQKWQTYSVTAAGDITFTEPPYPIHGDKLHIAVKQVSSGTPVTVTFPASFKTARALSTTLNQWTSWTFTYVPFAGWVSN